MDSASSVYSPPSTYSIDPDGLGPLDVKMRHQAALPQKTPASTTASKHKEPLGLALSDGPSGQENVDPVSLTHVPNRDRDRRLEAVVEGSETTEEPDWSDQDEYGHEARQRIINRGRHAPLVSQQDQHRPESELESLNELRTSGYSIFVENWRQGDPLFEDFETEAFNPGVGSIGFNQFVDDRQPEHHLGQRMYEIIDKNRQLWPRLVKSFHEFIQKEKKHTGEKNAQAKAAFGNWYRSVIQSLRKNCRSSMRKITHKARFAPSLPPRLKVGHSYSDIEASERTGNCPSA